MTDIKSLGIIGMGAFGTLASTLIPKDTELRTFDETSDHSHSFNDTASADVVLLAVPLQSFPQVLSKLAKVIKPETLLIDICSVKVLPEQLIAEHLPDHANLLISHPLFGPQTFGDTDLQLIVTSSHGERAQMVLDFCDMKLGLEIVRMTAEQHDKHMANVHALTMFVARACAELDVASEPIRTPSFQKLVDLEKLDRAHTEALFQTIQNGNPYAKAARKKLLNKLSYIERELTK